jgi:hypothetical protein
MEVPLYPALYPGTDFWSKKQPAAARGESEKNLVPIERISAGAPRQNAAKSAFSDFKSQLLHQLSYRGNSFVVNVLLRMPFLALYPGLYPAGLRR